MTKDIARVNLSVGDLLTVEHDGEPWVVLKPAIEALGLTWQPQHAKLKQRSWAVIKEITASGMDGKQYKMTCCTVDTFLMLLATIHETKVRPDLQPTLVAYQRETRRAVGEYWTRGQVVQHPGLPVDMNALNIAGAAMADARAIIGRAMLEASEVLARAGRSITDTPDEQEQIEGGRGRRKEIARQGVTSAEERRHTIARMWWDAVREDPSLTQAAFISSFNKDRQDDDWVLHPPYLSRAIKEFPDESASRKPER